ncbi:MAG: ATP-binding protein [Kiritimatiellae bacterium]|nr:ATP-binding protein [Kiritimatiellia bacterium]
MTRDIYVQARADHVASLASATPLSAIEELVWNALDADAREVKVDLVQNPLGGIDAVRVADDGSGIDILRAEDTFGSLGGSWKKDGSSLTVAYGRRLHGRHGRGRFKAFALGSRVEWRTTMKAGEGLLSYTLSGDAAEPGLFHIEQAASPGPATGTEVYITGVRATVDSLLYPDVVVQALAARFALYLKAYPDVSVYFCGIPVSPVIVQKHVDDYTVRLENGQEARLEVIEWRKRFSGKGRIVFCGRDGFALYERPSGVRSGQTFSYTAYMQSARFAELSAENALVMDELHPEVRAWLDAARRVLKEHFHRRAEEEGEARLAKWIAEKSYPFAADDASDERRRFDEGVADMRAHLDGFDAMPPSERAYLFNLLKSSLLTTNH